MMSRIKIDGILKPKAVKMFVDDFLCTNTLVDNIRDIWYKIKHKIESWKPKRKTEKDWADDVNEDIGEYLFSLYLSGDIGIYDRINLLTKALTNDGYKYNTPILLACEKPTRAFNKVKDELLAAYYESTGQIPSYEIVKIAEYLLSHNGQNEVYFIGMVDFDPAGESIFSSAVARLKKVLHLLAPEVTLISHKVEYGATYEEIIGKYDSYTLSSKQASKWEGGQGVEINVIDDKTEHIDRTIIDGIDPHILEDLSISRARNILISARLNKSEEYGLAKERVDEIEKTITDAVNSLEYTFTPRQFWEVPIFNGMVRNMSTIHELVEEDS